MGEQTWCDALTWLYKAMRLGEEDESIMPSRYGEFKKAGRGEMPEECGWPIGSCMESKPSAMEGVEHGIES